jgi:hypothetical protein
VDDQAVFTAIHCNQSVWAIVPIIVLIALLIQILIHSIAAMGAHREYPILAFVAK